MFGWIFFWKKPVPKSVTSTVVKAGVTSEKGVIRAQHDFSAAQKALTRASRFEEFSKKSTDILIQMASLGDQFDALKVEYADVI